MNEAHTRLDVTDLPLCQFLARVFIAEPDAPLLQSCREGPGARLLADCAGDPVREPGAARMVAALGGTDLAALSHTWVSLFSGASGPESVSPYASTYSEGRLYGAATARMQAELVRLDMAVAADCQEPPDHVAIELTVLGELLWREPVDAAEAFCRTELAWLPELCGSCTAHDLTGFYAGAAMLAAAVAGHNAERFIGHDVAALIGRDAERLDAPVLTLQGDDERC